MSTRLTQDVLSCRLIFVGGKGGVGKTTTAAALALSLARKSPNDRFMLISTDPAHSLSDVFGLEIGSESTPICRTKLQSSSLQPPVSNLHARELDASILLDGFKVRHGKEIKLLAERGTYFDSEDIQSFFDLSLPGIDEVMAVLEIAGLLDDKGLKCLVVDTAPTGHTLSLLRLPKVMEVWLDVFDLMQEKHHILQTHFAGRRLSDSVDAFLEKMRSDIRRVQLLLHNQNSTEFQVVMLPDALSLMETRRLIAELHRQKVPIHHLVVNGVYGEAGCPVCSSVLRRQGEVIAALEDLFPSLEIFQVPMASGPIAGLESLQWFASYLEGRDKIDLSSTLTGKKKYEIRDTLRLPSGQARYEIRISPLSLSKLMKGNPKLWIIGGKGGVGKTTVACATALRFAGEQPSRSFLLFSIDPAHSLSDCLDMKIGNKETKVIDNLYAMEIDAGTLLERFKEDYSHTIDELFDGFFKGSSYQAGMDLGHDRKLLHGLIEMSPPGLEELMALYKVISILKDGGRSRLCAANNGRSRLCAATEQMAREYSAIIFDTAPSGHLFRFLELPHLLRQWLQAIFRLLIKYKHAVPLGAAAEKLVDLSKDIRKIHQMLKDRKETRTVVVTTPEPMVVAETKRFIDKLEKLHIPLTLMVVNMLREGKDCNLCRNKGKEQIPMVKRLKKMGPKEAVSVPLFPGDIRGLEKLKGLGEMMYE